MSMADAATGGGLDTPPGYQIHDAQSLRWYIAGRDSICAVLGGGADDWTIEEVGDGNLNLVFKVRGPKGGVAIKQALPYVRLVGESWPLPLYRAHFEHMALVEQARHAPGLVPAVVHYDSVLALIAMELLEPHIIMRHGMIDGVVYPHFAGHISTFMANTLFSTSSLALPADRKKALDQAFAGNVALCKITEDLIFTEPYMVAENNRWTTPYLDPLAVATREDAALKVAVSRLKMRFMDSREAMIHGDLHTGSVMLTETETRVIDPEFAFVGPMGFDVGAVLGNLLLNYFSQIGHEDAPGARDPYRAYVLKTVEEVWTLFREKFLALWAMKGTGDGYPAALFEGEAGQAALATARDAYMDRLLQNSLGFAAAKMTRRLLGLAHNIDLEWIEDERVRATAEARALILARDMMVNTETYKSITDVTAAAMHHNALIPELGA